MNVYDTEKLMGKDIVPPPLKKLGSLSLNRTLTCLPRVRFLLQTATLSPAPHFLRHYSNPI